ncbi:MAG: hypothetical protein ACTHZ9_00130 [Leucobacter sp.]
MSNEYVGQDPEQPTETPASTPTRERGVRTGPIIWGALILAFCGYVLQRALAPGSIDTAVWVTGLVLGLGALLLVVGVTVAIRGRGRDGDSESAT